VQVRLAYLACVINLARVPRHCPTPALEFAVSVNSLNPFFQILTLDFVLFGILVLRFQDEHVAAAQPNEEVTFG